MEFFVLLLKTNKKNPRVYCDMLLHTVAPGKVVIKKNLTKTPDKFGHSALLQNKLTKM